MKLIKPSKLLFGSAGIPLSTPDRNISNGVKHVRKLGLDAMELEFVRSVNVSEEKAPLIKEIAKKNKVGRKIFVEYENFRERYSRLFK